MRLQVWRNQLKKVEDDPDYVIKQRQRTGADDGSPAYETVQVGVGYKQEAPDGEVYLDLKIDGLTDNKPKHGN